jgi:hydroxymethylbilane synthase
VQARAVAARLDSIGVAVELVTITTSGDRLQQAPLSDPGGKQLFVKEIDDALIAGTIDLAVHSAKDMPAVLPEGIEVAAALPREDPRDAIVLPRCDRTMTLTEALTLIGETPTIGTGSVRRVAQLAALMPRAVFAPIRGNVDTRIRKLDAGEFSAVVLAMAGMRRLGLASRISAALDVEYCIPAPGQGIVAIEARTDDHRTKAALSRIDDRAASVSLRAERAVVAALGGSCRIPLGAVTHHDTGRIRMRGVVASLDGQRVVRSVVEGSEEEAAATGRRLADELVAGGAGAILGELRES